MDELRLLVRSMMDRLLGLFSRERFASDMSAVTLVIATLTYSITSMHTIIIVQISTGSHVNN